MHETKAGGIKEFVKAAMESSEVQPKFLLERLGDASVCVWVSERKGARIREGAVVKDYLGPPYQLQVIETQRLVKTKVYQSWSE